MKILHGSIRTNVRVKVDPLTYSAPGLIEKVPDHGHYQEHGDATFSVDPDGSLYIYGDPAKPAHHAYTRHQWLWVGNENSTSVYNTAYDDPIERRHEAV